MSVICNEPEGIVMVYIDDNLHIKLVAPIYYGVDSVEPFLINSIIGRITKMLSPCNRKPYAIKSAILYVLQKLLCGLGITPHSLGFKSHFFRGKLLTSLKSITKIPASAERLCEFN